MSSLWPPDITPSSSSGPASGAPFGSVGTEYIVTTKPPIGLLVAGLAGPILSAAALMLHGWVWNVVGWLVAFGVGFGLLVLFTTVDLKRRNNPAYLALPVARPLRLVLVVLALVVAGIHAYLLADYVARLDMWAAH